MDWLLAAPFIALMLLGVGWFGWRKWKADSVVADLDASKRRLDAGLDNPELDEDFARQVTIDQGARDKGAV